MTDQQLQEFIPFWTYDAKKYVLVSVEPASTDLNHCVIVHRERRSAELIEDPELAIEVMRRMIDAGVEIVLGLPE
jgi:hypothetical protein